MRAPDTIILRPSSPIMLHYHPIVRASNLADSKAPEREMLRPRLQLRSALRLSARVNYCCQVPRFLPAALLARSRLAQRLALTIEPSDGTLEGWLNDGSPGWPHPCSLPETRAGEHTWRHPPSLQCTHQTAFKRLSDGGELQQTPAPHRNFRRPCCVQC